MSKPLLCVTVTASSTTELRRRRDAAIDADLVELRLDSVADPDVEGALAGRQKPVIVTCRAAWEGGLFRGSEEERRRLLARAIDLGAEYVDIEWKAQFDELVAARGGRGIVLSHHRFDETPADMPALVRRMRSTGAEVVKLAVQATKLSDCVPLMALGSEDGQDGRLVLIAMGAFGVASRVLPGRFGSRWTYAGDQQHVGQLSSSALVHDYRFRQASAATQVYGLTGLPIAHSVSPAMHNAAFRSLGIDAVYLPLPAVSADDFVTFGRAFGISGASVTIPHKVALFECLDDVSEVARRIGAINTIRVSDGRWEGANTDVHGFLEPLLALGPVAGWRAAVLGSGGSARAVALGLASAGCDVRVHARDRAKGEQVAALVGATAGPYPPEPGSWDLLVNCTPVGMSPRIDESPVAPSAITGRCVYDLIYNPIETRLLRDAARAGCRTIGGLDMLVAQAREQFHWWTGLRPPSSVMHQAAVNQLSESMRHETDVV